VDAGDFVDGDGYSNLGAADCDTEIRFFRSNAFAHGLGEIRIVHGVLGAGALVVDPGFRAVTGNFSPPVQL
jgi:hypothetical protein